MPSAGGHQSCHLRGGDPCLFITASCVCSSGCYVPVPSCTRSVPTKEQFPGMPLATASCRTLLLCRSADAQPTVPWMCRPCSSDRNWGAGSSPFPLVAVDASTKPLTHPGGRRAILACQRALPCHLASTVGVKVQPTAEGTFTLILVALGHRATLSPCGCDTVR